MDPQHVITRTVDMHVVKLRKKLGETPRRPSVLQTVRGSGYRVRAGYGHDQACSTAVLQGACCTRNALEIRMAGPEPVSFRLDNLVHRRGT